MTDRESFEDSGIIDAYLGAIPRVDSRYRATLRARLSAIPVVQRDRQWLRRWWPAPVGVAVAATIAGALLASPFGTHHGTPLDPKSVLARALSPSDNTVPYSGRSVVSYIGPRMEAPQAAVRDVRANYIVSQWTVRDDTHWRVNVHVLRPALMSEHDVTVADGSSIVLYSSLSGRAVRYRLTGSEMGRELLNTFQRSGAPVFKKLKQYVRAFSDPQSHTHARIVGQTTLLGRTADVVEFSPLYTTDRAPASCAKSPRCLKPSTYSGYGRARLWGDHQYGFVLRYQESLPPVDIPRGRGAHGFVIGPRYFLYRVTSLTFGSGPTKTELSYRSPTRPITVHDPGGEYERSSFTQSGLHGPWRIPAGFLAPGPLVSAQGQRYGIVGGGRINDSLFGPISTSAVYRLNPAPGAREFTETGPFVYLQELHRSGGLPDQLRRGRRHAGARCTVYTGSYADGLRWMALARGRVSLLAVANRLSQLELARWGTRQICR
ncbi:MAG: hypothetical protein ACR2GA_08135 [Chloroflexota bacterium]